MEMGDLKHLRSIFSHLSDEVFSKLMGKSAFPYCYLDSLAKFSASVRQWLEKQSSGHKRFRWKRLSKCLGKLQSFFLHNFRRLSWHLPHSWRLPASSYCWDVSKCMSVSSRAWSCSFFSAPNQSCEAILITSKIKIELLPDIGMLPSRENPIRGGINGVGGLRTFKANNKFMKSFNAKEESIFGAFYVVTSFYVGSMEQQLPLDEYDWTTDLTLNYILFADPSGDIGLYLI